MIALHIVVNHFMMMGNFKNSKSIHASNFEVF